MSAGAVPPVPTRAPMHIVGLVVLAGLFFYFAFMALDTMALESKTATARVVSMGYRAAGRTYATQIVNNRPLVIPHTVPETFLAELDIAGTVVTASVDKDVQDRLRPGDEVMVTVARTRLTGRIDVLDVRMGVTGSALNPGGIP